MLGSRVFHKIPDVGKYTGLNDNEQATGVKFSWENREITMNFMPASEVKEHLDGFSGWVQKVLDDKDQLIYVLARIRYVRMVLGCVVEPGFDEEGLNGAFLFNFNMNLNGLLFYNNTIFDFDGEPIAGMYYDIKQEKEVRSED